MNSPIDELRKRVAEGMSQDEAIDAIQRHGLPIIEAIKVMRELYGINLGDAKNAVASHSAYAQAAEASRPLQDEAIRAFQEIATENSPQK